MSLGEFLRAAREDAGLTRREVCRVLGIGMWRMAFIECGETKDALPSLVEWAELVQLYMLDAEDVARGVALARRLTTGREGQAAPESAGAPSPRFGAWLRRCSEAAGMSVVELSRHLSQTRGATTAQVAAWFHGRAAPDAAQWSTLCTVLGLGPELRAEGLAALQRDRMVRAAPGEAA